MGKQTISGVVEGIFAKEIQPDNYGNTFRLSVKLDDGNFYGFGTGKKDSINFKVGSGWHQLAKGDQIEFMAESRESNGRTFWNAKKPTLELKSKGQGTSNGRNATSGAVSGGPSRGGAGQTSVNYDDKQDQIMRQNAMGHAAAIVAATLGKADAGKTARLDEAAEEIVRLAEDYFFAYAKTGRTKTEANNRKEEQDNENQSRQADEFLPPPAGYKGSAGADFDDDIPF